MPHTVQGDLIIGGRLTPELAHNLAEWQASVPYLAGDVVRSGTSFIMRLTDGTSGATFDATEASNWYQVAPAPLETWTGLTAYSNEEIVRTQYENGLLRRSGAGTTPATFTVAETSNWDRISNGMAIQDLPLTGGTSFPVPANYIARITSVTADSTIMLPDPSVWADDLYLGDMIIVADISGDLGINGVATIDSNGASGQINGSTDGVVLDFPYAVAAFVLINTSSDGAWVQTFLPRTMDLATGLLNGSPGSAPTPKAGEQNYVLSGSGWHNHNAVAIINGASGGDNGGNVPFTTIAQEFNNPGITYTGTPGQFNLPEGTWILESSIRLSGGEIADLKFTVNGVDAGARGSVTNSSSSFSTAPPGAIVTVPFGSSHILRLRETGTAGDPSYDGRSWMRATKIAPANT